MTTTQINTKPPLDKINLTIHKSQAPISEQSNLLVIDYEITKELLDFMDETPWRIAYGDFLVLGMKIKSVVDLLKVLDYPLDINSCHHYIDDIFVGGYGRNSDDYRLVVLNWMLSFIYFDAMERIRIYDLQRNTHLQNIQEHKKEPVRIQEKRPKPQPYRITNPHRYHNVRHINLLEQLVLRRKKRTIPTNL